MFLLCSKWNKIKKRRGAKHPRRHRGNRPYHGFRRYLTGRQSGQKYSVRMGIRWQKHFPKSNFAQFVSRNVKIVGRRLYSPSLEDVAQLEDVRLIFLIFQTQQNTDKCMEN